jgi:transcriptional/translational regulatory protein YebC/TACO1
VVGVSGRLSGPLADDGRGSGARYPVHPRACRHAVLDAGAEDAIEESGELIVYTEQKELAKVRKAIIEAGLSVVGAELQYVPNISVDVDDVETAEKIIKLFDAIDELDDVVNVHSNANITADLPD